MALTRLQKDAIRIKERIEKLNKKQGKILEKLKEVCNHPVEYWAPLFINGLKCTQCLICNAIDYNNDNVWEWSGR